MSSGKLRKILEAAYLVLAVGGEYDTKNSLIGALAIARDKVSAALALVPTKEEPVSKNPIYVHPKGLKGKEEIVSAVMEAGRALFGYGLAPEETKEALIMLRDYINNLLDKEDKLNGRKG